MRHGNPKKVDQIAAINPSLPEKTELDEFLRGVDELRETADRIETRLGRLEQRLKGVG